MSESVKEKIRRLLALSSSPHPEEARLAMERAQKLMVKHAIEEEELAEDGKATRDIITRVGHLNTPQEFRGEISLLIGVISEVNSCTAVLSQKWNSSVLLDEFLCAGHRTDVENTLQIFEFLMGVLKVEYRVAKRLHGIQDRGEARFRRGFSLGFITEVSKRLQEAYKDSVTSSTELVLANRKEKVKEFIEEEFGEASEHQPRVNQASRQGYVGGQQAGQRVDLSTHRKVTQ